MGFEWLKDLADAVGQAAQNSMQYTANAAAQANSISSQAQAAQAAFNQESANQANMLTDNRISSQYGFNAAQAAMANQFNIEAWERAANWNSEMWDKQAAFNAEQAQLQREWQERMANTQYQRSIKDMEKAGLNPILAVTGGGFGTGVPGGAAASVAGAQMNSAQANMASGGLLGADSASINNYSGQMEYTAGFLSQLSALFSGISSAQSSLANIAEESGGMFGISEEIANSMTDLIFGTNSKKGNDYKQWNSALATAAKYEYDQGGVGGLMKWAGNYYKDWWTMDHKDFKKKYYN